MTKPRKHETLDLQVSNLAYGGKGIARREGFVFFVAGAVPGDVVRATVTKVKKNYAEARLEEILEPSPEPVSYTHLRAHETDSYLVCRLLLEKKKKTTKTT